MTSYDLVAVICHHGTAGGKIIWHFPFSLKGIPVKRKRKEKLYLCKKKKFSTKSSALPLELSIGESRHSNLWNLSFLICFTGGHYTAYALNAINEQWYEFDDQYVTEVDQQVVENCEAYVLFYRYETFRVQLFAWSLKYASLRYIFVSNQLSAKFTSFVTVHLQKEERQDAFTSTKCGTDYFIFWGKCLAQNFYCKMRNTVNSWFPSSFKSSFKRGRVPALSFRTNLHCTKPSVLNPHTLICGCYHFTEQHHELLRVQTVDQ